MQRFLSLWIPLVVVSACTASTERQAPPDWSAGYASNYTSPVDTGDTIDTDTGDTLPVVAGFGLTVPTDLGYTVRAADLATGGDCVLDVAADTSGYQDLTCTLDLPELNLYGSGLDFDFGVPEGACDYWVYDFYMYEAWEVGTGPTEASYTVDVDGLITDRVNVDGDGVPVCEYDYSYSDAQHPNCCLGTYTLTVTVLRQDAETKKVITEERVYPNRSWDAYVPDCYGGAAFTDPDATFNVEGWPTAKIVHLAREESQRRFSWDPPAEDFGTNVSLANHYDAADHGGLSPAGLRGYRARPHYTFQCYDNAEELLAEVRLVVREWNEEAEFLTEGDPDTTGSEPVSGTPINDRQDWADATPGADTFIQDRQ